MVSSVDEGEGAKTCCLALGNGSAPRQSGRTEVETERSERSPGLRRGIIHSTESKSLRVIQKSSSTGFSGNSDPHIGQKSINGSKNATLRGRITRFTPTCRSEFRGQLARPHQTVPCSRATCVLRSLSHVPSRRPLSMPASLRFLRCWRVPGQTLLFHRCASAPRLLLGGVPLSSAASRWVSTHDPCVFASAGVAQRGGVAQREDAEFTLLTGSLDRDVRPVLAAG